MEYKDLHDFIRQLTEDETFVDWVRSDFALHDDHWSAFVDEHIDHMDAINDAIRIVRDLNFNQNSNLDKGALWTRIEKSVALDIKPKARIFNLKYVLSAVVAACLAFFMFSKLGFMSDDMTEFHAPIAKVSKELLPDQSAVTLSPGAKMSYNTKTWSKKRKVTLDGLAFFEVKKGETFVVETSKGNVTVLGTSFSVDTRFGHFEVICKTGKVKVQDKQGNEEILNPGDKTYADAGTLVSTKSDSNGEISWITGTYTFENEKLEYVLEELEKQFGVSIDADKYVLDQKYTGFFKTGNLKDALFSVTWPMKLKFEIDGSRVKIYSE